MKNMFILLFGTFFSFSFTAEKIKEWGAYADKKGNRPLKSITQAELKSLLQNQRARETELFILRRIKANRSLNHPIRAEFSSISEARTPMKHLFLNVILPQQEDEDTFALFTSMIQNGAHLNLDDDTPEGSILNCLCRHWRPELVPYIDYLLECGADPHKTFKFCPSVVQELRMQRDDNKESVIALCKQHGITIDS
jgi:hypothetical protein